ncbi:MAG: ferritin-like domain-containing protein [Gammaproteobacteria bacterium]|nr:ferritin-like domain-containing protein [Gammaproteobacteria bacterium]
MNAIDDAELVARLNELLEAERAGARVALESIRDAQSETLADLMRAVQADEARWCAMLHRAITALGAIPSSSTGAFYGKAMAIGDWHERLAFLNRGQGWVVRKLRDLLPKVRQDGLRRELSGMLQAHEANIARVNDSL